METISASAQRPILEKLKSWGFKPLVLDFYIQRVWKTFSLERILARVVSTEAASSTATTIRLRPNFRFRNFQAGQHVLVTLPINGQRLTRTYSPTLLPDGTLELTVKASGKVSRALCTDHARKSTIEISEPFGEMTWSHLGSGEFTFLAGGVGITPLRSLIREWAKNPQGSIALHYWAKSQAEFCFRDELLEIASRLPNFILQLHSSDIDRRRLNQIDLSGTIVACGPAEFVFEARALSDRAALKFFGEHASGQAPETAAEDEAETFFDVEYDGRTIRASSQKTILESLEENGIEPAYGCRMGICKSCTCLKVSGTTMSSRDLSPSGEAREEIQICVASPRSALKIERY